MGGRDNIGLVEVAVTFVCYQGNYKACIGNAIGNEP